MMKSLSAALAIALFVATLVQGQSGLVVTGSVVGVTASVDSDASKRDKYVFEVELYLQFQNNTDNLLIVFAPARFEGTKRIAFQDELSSTAGSFISAELLPSIRGQYGPRGMPYLLYTLRQQTPSVFAFAVIQPHGYYEARDKVRVRNGYKVETRPVSKSFGKSSVLVAIPEFPALKVQYLVASNTSVELSEALATAKTRWSDLGTLFLNSSGDYDVTSEVILNKITE